MFKRLLLAVIALTALALPAHAYVIYIPYTITVPAAEIGDYSNIHTVGVISAVGGKLRVYKNKGFLSHDTAYRDILDWKIDDLVRATVHETLGQRFQLIDIPVDQAKIADQIDPGLFMGNQGPLRSLLKSLNRTDVDAYLVVRPRYYGDFPGTEAGLAVEATSESRQSWLYANYEVTLVDAKTFNQIGASFARMRLDDGTPPHFPGIRPQQDILPDDKLAFDDAQWKELHNWMGSLVRLSLIETLRALELGVEMPRAGGRSVVARRGDQLALPAGAKLAVLSAVGDALFLEHHGTMFRHSQRSQATGDTKLDQAIETQVAAAIDPRFKVVPAPAGVDRARLTMLIGGGNRYNNFDNLPSDPGVDAYVIVLKREDSGGQGFKRLGFGLVNWTPLGDEVTTAFANYSIVVVDAKTHRQIYGTDGVASPDREMTTPKIVVDSKLYPEEKPFTPQQVDGLDKAFLDLMADSVPETLLRLGFTGKMVVRPGHPPTAPHPAPAAGDGDSGDTGQGAPPKS